MSTHGARNARRACAQRARQRSIVMLVVTSMIWSAGSVAQSALPLDRITLPQGFVIETVARVPNARAMTWGSEGTLFVGSANAGSVYAVTLPRAGTQDAAKVRIIASNLREPAGVAFRNGALYVSAISRILRYDDIEAARFPARSGRRQRCLPRRRSSWPQIHRLRS
jgi:glucose/arabinose dehydrogenase